MATIGKLSPNVFLNSSMSPNLNMSDQLKFLMPPKSTSKNWSPLDLLNTEMKSPNLSPIPKIDSPSDFLKRRDYPKDRKEENKKRRHTCFNEVFTIKNSNPNLETKLSVRTILKDLKLEHLNPIFEQEEINLKAFFTLSNDDLQAIGIENDEVRKKLLDFITCCSTPKDLKRIPAKNTLIRH